MDLTTLTYVLLLVFGAAGVDAVLHPTSVVLEASVPSKLDGHTIDSEALETVLSYEVNRIASTPSVLAAPEIQVASNRGLGMAFAEAANMRSVALALQDRFGYRPERIKLVLLAEQGQVRLLVSGSGLGGRIYTPPFQETLPLRPGESLASLVHRGAVVGMSRIDPYMTSLYLLQHAQDNDFSEAEALINASLTDFPPTPVSYDRSLFQNLQGIIALFRNQPERAHDMFELALASDAQNVVARLNTGFVHVQVQRFRDAIAYVRPVVAMQPPPDKILLATAYATWGAALLGLHDVDGADAMLAKAIAADPESSTGYELWAEVKREKRDNGAAARMHRRALEMSGAFENYSEVAALYFQLSWRGNAPVTRSPFVNPNWVRFN